jgi:hypothetical protein
MRVGGVKLVSEYEWLDTSGRLLQFEGKSELKSRFRADSVEGTPVSRAKCMPEYPGQGAQAVF